MIQDDPSFEAVVHLMTDERQQHADAASTLPLTPTKKTK